MAAQSGRRIVITGATGMIGSELVRRLAEQGDHVIVFSRNPEQARQRLPKAAEYCTWSASMPDGDWVRKIASADGVINLAGAPIAVRWTEERKKEIRDSRVNGTRHLVDAMRRAEQPPKVLINASAVGFYGFLQTEQVTEDSSPGNDFLASVCVDWEAAARKAEEFGVRVAMVRTGIVLDPDGGALERMLTPFKLFVGGPIGSGRQPFPWVHIADEIGIYLWALDNQQVRGPVNAVAPGIVNNRKFSQILGDVMHRPSLVPVPTFVLEAMFGEGATIVTGGQNAIPERTLSLGYNFAFTDPKHALTDLLE